MALASLKKELAARDKQLAAKDALITQLTQQQVRCCCDGYVLPGYSPRRRLVLVCTSLIPV